MESVEDFEDRNREAPVTSYDMGLNDYDIIPDPYSPKWANILYTIIKQFTLFIDITYVKDFKVGYTKVGMVNDLE